MTTAPHDNTNRFAMFENREKRSDRSPDFSGTINVAGVEYFIDGWSKTDRAGRPFMSGTIKRKERPGAAAPSSQVTSGRTSAPPRQGPDAHRIATPVMDDEIPF